MPDEKVKVLYDSLSSDYDLGEYEAFRQKLQDPEKRKVFFDAVSADYDLGDFEAFSQKVSIQNDSGGFLNGVGDFFSQLGQSTQRGILRVLPEQIGSAIDFADRFTTKINPVTNLLMQVPGVAEGRQALKEKFGLGGQAITNVANMIPAPEAQPELQQINGVEDLADPRKLANVIGEQGPAMLANVAATVANPGFGLAFMGAMEGGESLKSLDKIEGLSETNKLMIASGVGAMNAALERLGIDVILGKVPGLKSKIARLVLSPVTEGATEGLQEINQIIGENTGAGDPVFQFTPEDIARLKSSVYGGGVLGLIGGGLGAISDQQSAVSDQQKELTIEDVDAAVSRAVVPGDDVADVQAEAARNAAEFEAKAKAEAEIEQRAADAGIVIPETVQGPQRTQMIEQLLKQREADARNAERENTAKAKLIEEKSAMSRAQAEIEQGKKKKEKGKSDATTVRSWLRQSGLRIKTDDLKRHGFGEGSQENRNLILQVGHPEGVTADEAAMQAIEGGIIDPPPPDYNPADWLMTQVRDNAPTTSGREQQLQQQADEGFGVISGKQTSPQAPLQRGEKQGAESDSEALKSGKVASVSEKTDVSALRQAQHGAPLNDRIKDKKTLKSAMVQAFGFDEQKADAVSEVYDAVADAWAKQRGVSKDEWYQQRIGDVKRSLRVGDDEVMFQLDQNDFTPERIKSFNIKKGVDATGDVVAGDIVLFKEAVFEGSFKNPKYKGDRWIKAKIVNDSYGKDKQQHTFSLEVIESNGIEPLKAGQKTRRKGRNIYKNGVMRESWQNENERVSVADEKHNRGDVARALRDARKRGDTFYQTAKGAVEFKQTGEAIIHAFRQADVSTALHELAHIFRRDLDAADQQVVLDWFNNRDGASALRQTQHGAPLSAQKKGFDVEVEEAFARAFEKYIYEGKAPNAKLKAVFDKLKQWMRDIYKRLKGSAIDVELSPKMRNLFDRVLDGDVVPKAFLDRAPKSFGEYVQAMGVTVEQLKGDPGMLRYWREQYRARFKTGASAPLSDRGAVSGQRSAVSEEKKRETSPPAPLRRGEQDSEQVVRDANLKALGVDKGQFENAVDLQPGQVVTHETHGEVTIVKVDRGLVAVRNAQGNEISVGRKAFEAKLKGKSEKVKSADVLYQDEENIDTQTDLKKSLNKSITNLRQTIEDSEILIKELQRLPGIKITPSGDRYVAGKLFHGRAGSRVEQLKKGVESILPKIKQVSDKYNISQKNVISDLNTYLIARHAPDFNKIHGDKAAGITTFDAERIVKRIEGSVIGEDVRKLADIFYKLNDRTLDVLVDGGVILPKFRQFLKRIYPNHVPLNRIFDDQESLLNIEEAMSKMPGGGLFTSQAKGIESAQGSGLLVDDILTNITYNITNAIKIAEKNYVNLHTFNFVRNNPQLEKSEKNPDGIFKIHKPISKGKNKYGVEEFDLKSVTDDKDRKFKNKLLPVKLGGKPWYLEISDPALAAAYKGTNIVTDGAGMKFIEMFKIPAATRLYANLATAKNIDFPIPNMFRDTQEMYFSLAAIPQIGFKGAFRAIKGNIPSLLTFGFRGNARVVYDWIKGKDTADTRLFEEMVRSGGTTGGIALSTRKAINTEIMKMWKTENSPIRKRAQQFLRTLDALNQIFEDASRFGAYKAAREQGMNKFYAAYQAKQSTIDFNTVGTATPFFNAVYMFSKASVLGSVKTIRAMKNPKVAVAMISAVALPTMFINAWNDEVDENWREKVSKWDRKGNLTILLPSEDGRFRYVTLPVAWGLKPWKVIVDHFDDMLNGKSKDSVLDISKDVVITFLDAYNPLGGSTIGQALTPSVFDPINDVDNNVAWHGNPIYDEKEHKPGLPNYMKYFSGFGDTKSEQISIDIAKGLEETTGIDISPQALVYVAKSYGSGALKSWTKIFDTTLSLSKGELPEARSIPIISRFYKSISKDQADKIQRFNAQKNSFFNELQRQEAIEDQMRSVKAWKTLEAYNATNNPEEQREVWQGLLNTDPKAFILFKRYRGYRAKGLSYDESQLRTWEPERRAEYLQFELDAIKDADKRRAQYDDWVKKGIIDGSVKRLLRFDSAQRP